MFYKQNSDGYLSPAGGVNLKTLVFGEKMSLTQFVMEKGNNLPMHDHPHEQIGILLSGSIEIVIEDELFKAEPGDAWCVPGGVKHGANVFEDSVAIEVFSPVRDDYIP